MEEETYESDNDSEFWYESDLQLAAELGKTLLEKNKELESQLFQSQQANHEQSQEIEFLTKQLETLRDVNESRLKIYEEIEKNSQELEKANQKAVIEAKADKQHIQRLTEVIESLESKCNDLEDVVKEYKRAENTKKAYDKRKALSVPSLSEACDLEAYMEDYYSLSFSRNAIPLNKYEVEISKLRDNNRNLKSRLHGLERRTDEAEFEVALLMEENRSLKERVSELEKTHQEAKTYQSELDRHELSTGNRCSSCSEKNQVAHKDASDKPNPELSIEHDVHDEIKNGEVIKMKNGGSAYGSRESLNKVGIEADTDTSQNLSHVVSADGTPSLLGELDAQYSTLIAKYEALVEAKSRRKANKNMQVDTSTSFTSHKEVQTSVLYDKGLSPHRSRYGQRSRASRSNSPPEYKKLFREIFDTLKKSAIYEDEANKDQAAGATASKGQSKPI